MVHRLSDIVFPNIHWMTIRCMNGYYKKNSVWNGIEWPYYQQAHDVKTTSYQRRCDIMTLHLTLIRRCFRLCACWVGVAKVHGTSIMTSVISLN